MLYLHPAGGDWNTYAAQVARDHANYVECHQRHPLTAEHSTYFEHRSLPVIPMCTVDQPRRACFCASLITLATTPTALPRRTAGPPRTSGRFSTETKRGDQADRLEAGRLHCCWRRVRHRGRQERRLSRRRPPSPPASGSAGRRNPETQALLFPEGTFGPTDADDYAR